MLKPHSFTTIASPSRSSSCPIVRPRKSPDSRSSSRERPACGRQYRPAPGCRL